MILTKYALKNIKSEMRSNGITGYIYLAPQGTSYPFCVFYPVSCSTSYTFSEIFENVIISMTIYSNNVDCEEVMDIAIELENIFTGYENEEAGTTIICTHKVSENGPTYIENSEYKWRLDMDFEFKCQRNKA